MPLRNPLGRIKDTALGTIKDPVGTAGRAVGQARGSVSTGRSIVGQVAGEVTSRLPRRGTRAGQAPEAPAEHPVPAEAPRKDQGDALADVHDRVHRPAKDRGTGVSATPADVADAVAKKAPAAKRKAPAKTTAEKKTAATTPGDKLPATRKAPAKKTAAKKSAAKKSAAKTAPAKKATTKNAPAKKSTAKKGPARKAAAGKATARKSSSAERPLSAAELAAGETPDVTTPVGTTGADVATNPDTTETDLQQPGTEPIVDPGTAKAVASEADTLRRAAQTDKG